MRSGALAVLVGEGRAVLDGSGQIADGVVSVLVGIVAIAGARQAVETIVTEAFGLAGDVVLNGGNVASGVVLVAQILQDRRRDRGQPVVLGMVGVAGDQAVGENLAGDLPIGVVVEVSDGGRIESSTPWGL